MRLNQSEILKQAMGILDDYGLADLSMRRLADSLGVKAGAIYWHYANKQTLLAAISDAILVSVSVSEGAEWAASLSSWGVGLRSELLRHRDSADVVSSTRAVGLGSIDPAVLPAEILMRAGWSERSAAQTARALVHFILGHVFEEQSRAELLKLGVLQPPQVALDEAGFVEGMAVFVAGLEVRKPNN